MAHTLAQIHDRRVIVADIALRNFLLSVDLSVRQCDFTESTTLPLETDMETADDNGYSIYTDIGQFGAVMYEAVTGQHCEFDLFKDQPPGPARASWPRREDLPPTENIWLCSIVERCWTKGAFYNARGLLAALEMVDSHRSQLISIPRERTPEEHPSKQRQDRSSQPSMEDVCDASTSGHSATKGNFATLLELCWHLDQHQMQVVVVV